MEARVADSRKETAERNVQAILDAAEVLLDQRQPVTIAAVAKRAGVSRVTVYAHFPTWEALLEGVVERAVARCTAALEAAEPTAGPPRAALERLLRTGWRILGQNAEMAAAAAAYLSSDALHRAHGALIDKVTGLLDRGVADGSFRTDLPVSWLVTAIFALIHACADEVRAGKLDPVRAEQTLVTTIGDLVRAR